MRGANVCVFGGDCRIRKLTCAMRDNPPFDNYKNILYGMRGRFLVTGGYLVCLGRTMECLTSPKIVENPCRICLHKLYHYTQLSFRLATISMRKSLISTVVHFGMNRR